MYGREAPVASAERLKVLAALVLVRGTAGKTTKYSSSVLEGLRQKWGLLGPYVEFLGPALRGPRRLPSKVDSVYERH